ncbi:hypothetical protein BKI49_20575 [Streptomyces sp. Tue6028]|uniref:hypothetical protein n=1 Tax=Streptomyces sp. Tue6028 TaxID=2036037 RepID=UPI000BB3BD3C|nr:hypothetical protein [Streptomyces sp. Tue6028]PBC61989.1 hypothetical protein BKI49_20575 [Streptomyces sp. Tue6028]
MTDRSTAPPGTGRRMPAEAERRTAAAGRTATRLDCLTGNPRLHTYYRSYYRSAGYTPVGRQTVEGGWDGPYTVTLFEMRL